MSRFNASEVAADIVKVGGPLVVFLEAVENIPGLGLNASGQVQGVVAAAITVLAAVMAVLKQAAVREAVARTVVAMSHAKVTTSTSNLSASVSIDKNCDGITEFHLHGQPATKAVAKKPAAKKPVAKKAPAKKEAK